MKEKRKQKNGRGYGSFREVKDKIEGEMEIRPPTHTRKYPYIIRLGIYLRKVAVLVYGSKLFNKEHTNILNTNGFIVVF